ncbi:hypothetical protein Pmar_PMAR018244, partial [Perkinsus marinus ATCC 50983]
VYQPCRNNVFYLLFCDTAYCLGGRTHTDLVETRSEHRRAFGPICSWSLHRSMAVVHV